MTDQQESHQLLNFRELFREASARSNANDEEEGIGENPISFLIETARVCDEVTTALYKESNNYDPPLSTDQRRAIYDPAVTVLLSLLCIVFDQLVPKMDDSSLQYGEMKQVSILFGLAHTLSVHVVQLADFGLPPQEDLDTGVDKKTEEVDPIESLTKAATNNALDMGVDGLQSLVHRISEAVLTEIEEMVYQYSEERMMWISHLVGLTHDLTTRMVRLV
jgi:hypothetical protein